MADRLRPVLIRFPPDLLDNLKAVAAAEERHISTTVRRAVRQYIERARAGEGGS